MADQPDSVDTDALSAQLLAALMKLYVRARRTDMAESGTGELSGAQYSVMRLLATSGGMRITDLAIAECVSVPTASVAVRRLVKQGLATRVAVPRDRRTAFFVLTERGHDALTISIAAKRHQVHLRLLEMDDTDLNRLADVARLLGRLVELA